MRWLVSEQRLGSQSTWAFTLATLWVLGPPHPSGTAVTLGILTAGLAWALGGVKLYPKDIPALALCRPVLAVSSSLH